jgi:hypothetical protein
MVTALTQTRGHIPNAANAIGVSRSMMYRKIKKFGIHPGEYGGAGEFGACEWGTPSGPTLDYEVTYIDAEILMGIETMTLYDATKIAKVLHAAEFAGVTVVHLRSGARFCVAGNGFKRLSVSEVEEMANEYSTKSVGTEVALQQAA